MHNCAQQTCTHTVTHTASAVCTPLLQHYEDDEDYQFVMEALLPEALEEMTSLTLLALTSHDMPVCPWPLAHLPALKRVDLSSNEGLTELPHGPWPALEHLDVDAELIEAALADPPAHSRSGTHDGGNRTAAVPAAESPPAAVEGPEQAQPAAEAGHALWSMCHLTHLGGLWMGGMKKEEKEEKKQAIWRLLPQLQHLE